MTIFSEISENEFLTEADPANAAISDNLIDTAQYLANDDDDDDVQWFNVHLQAD